MRTTSTELKQKSTNNTKITAR